MWRRKTKGLFVLMVVLLGIGKAGRPMEAREARTISPPSSEARDITALVTALKPTSLAMVDSAITVLQAGLQGMNDRDRKVLLQIFDPAGTGDIDEAYVRTLLENYTAVRAALNADFNVRLVNGSKCTGQRIYLTYLTELMVCPYFQLENNEYRKARTLVHEATHMALVVTDRHYYRPTSRAYRTLTPRGSWATQIPFVGPIFRELLKGDTLYHPDAYAHFAMAVSELPGAETYYDHGKAWSLSETAAVTTVTETQFVDSWDRN